MTNLSMFQAVRSTETNKSVDAPAALDLAIHLLGDTAHDLRAPLASARELVQMVADGADGPVSENQKKHLQEVVSRCNDMHRLIDDMLQFESAKTGTPKIHRCWVAPNCFPDEVNALVQSSLSSRNVTLNWIGFEESLPSVYVDVDKLKRFFVNLIGNAAQATPEGGRIDMKTEMARSGDRIRFNVSDHGAGMSAEQIQSVAQRGISQGGGQGLGLAICRQIASLHFTRVGFDSEIGAGSRFNIELPVGGPSAVIDMFAAWRESLLPIVDSPSSGGHRVRPKRRPIAASPTHMLPIDNVLPQFAHTVTMISAYAGALPDEQSAQEFDRFLQGQCHMHELVYRVENDQWIMLLDIGIGQTEERISQIGQAQSTYQDANVRQSAIQWFGPVSLSVGSKQDRQRLQEAFVRGSLGINNIEPAVDDSHAPVMSEVAQKRLEAEVQWITQNFKKRQRSLKSQANAVRPTH